MLALGLEEPREERLHREPIDVARMDSSEQRLREIDGRLAAEAPRHECAD